MPELPEVQMVTDSIQGIVGRKIAGFVSVWSRSCKNIDPITFDRKTFNERIQSVYRRWKFIVINTDSLYILCHLRMTGKLFIGTSSCLGSDHLSSYFRLDNGTYLVYDDIRKFGGFYLYSSLDDVGTGYGMDPYDKEFTASWLYRKLISRKRMIKAFLLDQSILAGLGNIYIDEVLWESGIDPRRLSNTIDKELSNSLHSSVLDTLNKSIEHHGTTIENFSFDQFKTGSYKDQLKAYMREGQDCKRCSGTIDKTRVAGRGTYLCRGCQR